MKRRRKQKQGSCGGLLLVLAVVGITHLTDWMVDHNQPADVAGYDKRESDAIGALIEDEARLDRPARPVVLHFQTKPQAKGKGMTPEQKAVEAKRNRHLMAELYLTNDKTPVKAYHLPRNPRNKKEQDAMFDLLFAGK